MPAESNSVTGLEVADYDNHLAWYLRLHDWGQKRHWLTLTLKE